MMTNTPSPGTPLPLTLTAPGETVRLVEIRLSGDEKQRLLELGLIPGTSIRVIKSDPSLGLIVSVRHDGRLALNRGTARKLIVYLER